MKYPLNNVCMPDPDVERDNRRVCRALSPYASYPEVLEEIRRRGGYQRDRRRSGSNRYA